MGVYVLAAGLQTRFDGRNSKLMSFVEGRPAFSYTMETLLDVFQEESICIISSDVYEDFNTFVSEELPSVDLLFDNAPGSGSAKSLERSYPWRQEWNFVTEANIFYSSDLIRQSLEVLARNHEASRQYKLGEAFRSCSLDPRCTRARVQANQANVQVQTLPGRQALECPSLDK